MPTPDDFKVNEVYEYETTEDLRRYYDDWAHAYNDYCAQVEYALPRIVAKSFVDKFKKDWGWVIDVGCGTGLVGKYLKNSLPQIDLHGIDLSPEMAKIAMSTGNYHWCSVADVKDHRQIISGRKYDGLISAGTFTLGHLGIADLQAIFSLLNVGSLVSISIKKDHYFNNLFGEKLIKWSELKLIKELEINEINGYDTDYSAPNQIATFILNDHF